jgi:hypothetical protein
MGLLGAACTLPIQANRSAKPTAKYAEVGGLWVGGGSYNIDKHNSIVGQFMWEGLPPSVGTIA